MPTVLVIDDNPAVATALEVLFSLRDLHTLRADSPDAGLAILRREANKGQALKLKQQLEALALTISANAGEEGKLFGSVTNIDIERALRERGFDIERRKIMLAEPIKQLGEFTVPVRLDPEVEAGVKLTVAAS